MSLDVIKDNLPSVHRKKWKKEVNCFFVINELVDCFCEIVRKDWEHFSDYKRVRDR